MSQANEPITKEQNPLVTDSQESTQNVDSQEESNQNEETNQEETDSKEEESNNQDEKTIKEEKFSSAKESTDGKLDTEELISQVAKLEADFEIKSSKKPDEKEFYKNINSYLTDDEISLKHEDDPSLYLDAVQKAKEKFLSENTVDTTEDQKKLDFARQQLHTAKAIDTVLSDSKYQDFNFVKLQDFYHNKLTNEEKRKLDKGSTLENLPQYLKKVHDEYNKRFPKEIKKVEAPDLPDPSEVLKTTVQDKADIESEEKRKTFKEKAGFKKL